MRSFHYAKAVPLALPLLVFLCQLTLIPVANVANSANVSRGNQARIPSAPPLPVENPIRSLAKLRSQLDDNDRLIAMRALHLALTQVPDGGTFIWRKSSRSLKGLIMPTHAFRNASGDICRHVIYALVLGRYVKQIEGIACRTGDGSWQL